MRRHAVFFDRDNTLIISDGYLGDPAQVRLVTGVAAAIARARLLGYVCVVFSNQSGVARGMFTEEAVHAVNNRLDELLTEQNPSAVIDRHEFCSFHPEGTVEAYAKESDSRKPGPGMILRAAEALALDLPQSWVIGDAPRDIEAGRAAGCRTILFQDPSLPASPAASATPHVLPDHYVQSLKDAIDIIERAAAMAAEPAVQSSRLNGDGATPARAPGSQPETPGVPLSRLPATPPPADVPFSFSKMFAGIVQVLALSALVLSYKAENPQNTLLLAIMLQLFTIALLIMGRQR